jgi:hypothetical protein
VFANNRTLDYCAELEHKKSYDALNATEKAAVDVIARDRFMAYGLLKTSSTANDKVKSDLSDDFTKGSDNYPITPQQTLLLLDKYSKKPAVVTQSEGTAFAQKDKKKGNANKKDETPKKVKYDKEKYKDLACFRCGKLGHPKAACTVKMVPADEETKSTKSSSTKGSSSSSTSDMGKMFLSINKTFKTMGKAMSQVSEEISAFGDEDSIGAQSHALVGVINGRISYAFANGSSKMKEFLLLDNQSSDHVFFNPEFVNNIRAAGKELSLHSNGGTLPIKNIADFDGFEESVWFSKQAMTNILSLAKVKLE